jgi:hypothetical protein
MILACDVDNVLIDTKELMTKYMCPQGAYYDDTQYYIHKDGMSDEQIFRWIEQILINYHDEVKPFTNTLKFLEFFYITYGTPIQFITARDPKLEVETKICIDRICKNHNFKYDVHLSETTKDKSELIEKLSINYLIDDLVKNFKGTEDIECFKQGILVKREWNRNVEIPSNVIEVYDVNYIPYLVNGFTEMRKLYENVLLSSR